MKLDLAKYPIFALAGGLAAAYLLIYTMPQAAEQFALNSKLYAGEFYRIITYQFVHMDKNHLLENFIGLGLVAGIATELKTTLKDFSAVYLLAGILAALPLFFFLNLTLLGASAAIFGAFGFTALEAGKFKIKPEHIIIAITGLVFAKTIYAAATCGTSCESFSFSLRQDSGHLLGLLFGIGAFYFIRKSAPHFNKNKRFVLRGSQWLE
ncbi:MAG TPA: rhomboid family intramembrane serine protease [Candidatus Nanoarchaeia archaeon]|nr:rhomboid family intramembrane serine protease [Candidatus Nanoarchaeia archaeon]